MTELYRITRLIHADIKPGETIRIGVPEEWRAVAWGPKGKPARNMAFIEALNREEATIRGIRTGIAKWAGSHGFRWTFY